MVANGMEGVPWMVGGGAKHSANVGRVLAFMASGGQDGIASPADLKVSPSSTPDGNVHVAVGAFSVLNRESNSRNEAYVGRGIAVSDIPISPSGSSPRSDLVVVRLRDPQYGYAAPSDVANGPYAFPEVVPGVPSNTRRADQVASLIGKSVYALARIDLPANTTAITAGMIKDLRKLAQAHQYHFVNQQTGIGFEQLTSSNWVNWPSNSIDVDVPPWATNAFVKVTLNTVVTDGASSDFNPRISFGGITMQSAAWDYNGSNGFGGEKMPFIMTADLDVRSIAGTTATLRTQAMRTFTSATGTALVQFDIYSQIIYEVDFQERPL